MGCYDDGLDGARDLDGGMSDDLYSMSKELCLSRCSRNRNIKYFGLQYGFVNNSLK